MASDEYRLKGSGPVHGGRARGILPGVNGPGQKVRVLLLAGGQSEEHEVSLASARSVLAALPQERFAVTTRVISREGRWLPPAETARALEAGSAPSGGELALHGAASAGDFDVVFPLLHGPMGEDGTVQGLFALAGLPCVGSGVLGSAVSMDKVMAKAVLAAHGVPQVPYQLVTRHAWRECPEGVRAQAAGLGFPLFCKPANLGSSVGIVKVHAPGELDGALALALSLDRRAILEAAAGGKPRELEVGILGNDAPIASPVGELSFEAEFYDYETKYTEGRAREHIPAAIPPEVAGQVRELALGAFRALDCAGLARVDFFYDEPAGALYLNEVNTMPGFTATSMYPKLWAAAGLSYPELTARLIELACEAR